MPVRSRRIFGPLLVQVAPTVIYTTPAGRTARILNVTLVGLDVPGLTITLYINGTGVAQRVLAVTRDTVEDGQLACTLVLGPGDILHAGGSAIGAQVTISGHGALLLGAPE